MKIGLKHYGRNGFAASIIDITVITHNTTISETITNLDGTVDIYFIASLEDIVEDLKKQNELIKQTKEK